MRLPRLGLPNLGLGVGLRPVHFSYILENHPPVDWFEVISENFMDSQGPAAANSGADRRALSGRDARRVAVDRQHRSAWISTIWRSSSDWPMRSRRVWVSDHVCWTGVAGINAHDLLPMPLNEATLRHVVERIRTVQDVLERPLVLGESQHVCRFRRLDDARMGVSHPHGGRGRLRPAAGREQRLRFEREQRFRSGPNISARCRTSAWCSSTWPATPTARRTSSTRTTTT